MKEIRGISHIANSLDKANEFYESVNKAMKLMQDECLEVELQYQQSDKMFSVLIIGRG